MKIIETYIVNYNDNGYYSLCKIHLLENATYVREYDTGKMTRMHAITKEHFLKQCDNPPF